MKTTLFILLASMSAYSANAASLNCNWSVQHVDGTSEGNTQSLQLSTSGFDNKQFTPGIDYFDLVTVTVANNRVVQMGFVGSVPQGYSSAPLAVTGQTTFTAPSSRAQFESAIAGDNFSVNCAITP